MPRSSRRTARRPDYKGGFGFHPLLAFPDNTGEALAGILRPGNANDAADHVRVLDLALAQLPEQWRVKPILIRAGLHALIAEYHQLGLGVLHRLSDHRSRADPRSERSRSTRVHRRSTPMASVSVAEITGMLDLGRWPDTMRVIVHRERSHPGAQLSVFEERDGWRYQALITNTGAGQLAFLDARHRAHAWVEDRIRTGKFCGIGTFLSQCFHITAVWLELALAPTSELRTSRQPRGQDIPVPQRQPPIELRFQD